LGFQFDEFAVRGKHHQVRPRSVESQEQAVNALFLQGREVFCEAFSQKGDKACDPARGGVPKFAGKIFAYPQVQLHWLPGFDPPFFGQKPKLVGKGKAREGKKRNEQSQFFH
jgi:hypothetical protein